MKKKFNPELGMKIKTKFTSMFPKCHMIVVYWGTMVVNW